VCILSCKTETKQPTIETKISGDTLELKYAKGFRIIDYKEYQILEVNSPFPKADKSFKYLLYKKGIVLPDNIDFDEIIEVPVKKVVVTSTTHIPSIEALSEEISIKGFPGLEYISSPKTRDLINQNKITELGKNEAINTEVLISLSPDVVIGFAIDGNNKTYNTISKSGIPVLYNGDWMEESPLGKAEWIKFFGALHDKEEQANRIFNEIEASYIEAIKLAKTARNKPSVLSGSMYKDQWYVPYGNSWSAEFIQDANASYIYAGTEGSGSISLSFESVLNDAQNVEFWIAPGQFKSFEQLTESSVHYNQFNAVQHKNVYTYSNTLGETGGVLYYELAPHRPDLVLKDLIAIFHPELMPNYNTVFFKQLD
jgi:iron complex transport system substrate-binding protein